MIKGWRVQSYKGSTIEYSVENTKRKSIEWIALDLDVTTFKIYQAFVPKWRRALKASNSYVKLNVKFRYKACYDKKKIDQPISN